MKPFLKKNVRTSKKERTTNQLYNDVSKIMTNEFFKYLERRKPHIITKTLEQQKQFII